MSANAMTQVPLTDDDGSGLTGTILNNALFEQVQDAVDTAIGQVVQTKSGGYTVVVTDDVVICTAALTLTLYAASGNSGRRLEVRNTSSANVTLDGNASETIDGAATYTVPAGQGVALRCDGANWTSVGSRISRQPPLDGVLFPATQVPSSDANCLDDYEEGTWTPAANGASVTVNSARYTKIGRLVHVTADVTWPATADTNQARLAGLPFTAGVDSAAAIGYNGSNSLAEALIQTATIFFYVAPNNGGTARTNANFSGATIKVSGTYTV